MIKNNQIGIVDIFAGPGGLSEGFASVGDRDNPPFRIALSIEKDAAACRTLRLRSAVHELDSSGFNRYIQLLNKHGRIDESLMAEEFPDVWARTEKVAHQLELSDQNQSKTEELLESVKSKYQTTGLIGGPPCQVYSLAGRARNAGNDMYLGDSDHRHTLYKQYIHVLNYLEPAFFVMENVKGMLSSEHQSTKIFPLVREDLQSAGSGYTLFALSPSQLKQIRLSGSPTIIDHRDFIVRSENFGVPQKRHRIIIVGVRNDLVDDQASMQTLLRIETRPETTVRQMLSAMPALRSGLSREKDSSEAWASAVEEAYRILLRLDLNAGIHEILNSGLAEGKDTWRLRHRTASTTNDSDGHSQTLALNFVRTKGLKTLISHETRSHIRTDLARYLFAAAFAEVKGYSAKQSDFPAELAPNHKNWSTGKFNDRFRVQVWDKPSTTITSHISKDGHYYIHPDPTQVRALTVREAARLQTFPDDYIFLGNRTEQYHQVGNAVPPFLASQIAKAIFDLIKRALLVDHLARSV